MANNNHFELTLDTQNPTGSITAERYYKQNGKVNITSAGNATYMYVWFDTEQTGTRPSSLTWEAAATEKATSFTEDGNYYYHLILCDEVGNESPVYNSEIITFDTTAPEVTAVLINDGDTYTNKLDNKVYFEFSTDDLSGISGGQITGTTGALAGDPINITFTAEELAAGKATRDFNFNDVSDDTYELTVTVTDAAGNTSAITPSAKDSIILDRTAAEAILGLKTADGTANLPLKVNEVDFTAVIDVQGTTSDVVGYKIWGNIADHTSEPATFTPVTKGTDPIVIEGLKFTNTDGDKNVYIRIIDQAGTVTPATGTPTGNYAATRLLDMTAPVVTITRDKAYISNVEGYNEVVISNTVTEEGAGQASYKLYVGSTAVRSGNGNVPESFTLTSADSMVANAENSIKLEVTDQAGNVGTSSPVIVTLDTLAPEGSITNVNTYYNAPAGFTASATDNLAGMQFMYCWVSATAADTDVKGTQFTYAANPTVDKVNWDNKVQGTNYLHIKYEDNVGNASFVHSAAFTYDDVAPVDGAIEIAPATNTETNVVTLTYNDATSGVTQFKIWGDITEASSEVAAEWQPIVTKPSITLAGNDGLKTIYVRFKDAAGNESVHSVSCTTILDRVKPTGTLELHDKDNTDAKLPNEVNIPNFTARISGTDVHDVEPLQYFIYGDFTVGAQKDAGIVRPAKDEDIPWSDYTVDSGKTYMSISNLTLTNGDALKYVRVIFKDDAGNITEPIVQTVTYDTTAPVAVATAVDHNRISKVHVLRLENLLPLTTYCDETKFELYADSKVKAYKVCAYGSQEDAMNGSAEDDPIPTTNGSINMQANGIELDANEHVACTIKGADLELASEGDGAKIVVVYVQDLAGTWSEAAQFSA